jgi:TPR repeat protein
MTVRSPARRGGRATLAALGVGLALALLGGASAAADPFEDGVAAQGRGDAAAAASAYRMAADQGADVAQFALGRLYLAGQGVAKDYAAARAWFEKAAAQGNPGAAYQLGTMSEAGLGGPRDAAIAAAWYRRAAERGFAPAVISQAELYRRGIGVAKDVRQAIDLVRPTAEAGDATAELELGVLYADAADAPSLTSIGLPQRQFQTIMDAAFGAGRWRETGGYRTPGEENRLRAAGAGTVPAGELSAHSLGARDAPGAYDVVVAGLSADQAAVRLRRSPAKFARMLAESAHGDQGPHLHVEPLVGRTLIGSTTDPGDDFIDRVFSGARPLTSGMDAAKAAFWLQLAAHQGEAGASPILEKLQSHRGRR